MSDMELVKEAIYAYAGKAGESFSVEALLRIEAELERLRADNEQLPGGSRAVVGGIRTVAGGE